MSNVDAASATNLDRAEPRPAQLRVGQTAGTAQQMWTGAPTKQIAINFPPEMQRQLHELAQREFVPIAQIVRHATRDYLALHLKPAPLLSNTGSES